MCDVSKTRISAGLLERGWRMDGGEEEARAKRPRKPAALKGITPARLRPLLKALHNGAVRISGGYGGTLSGGAIEAEDFDKRSLIDRAVAHRLLDGGPYANTYVLTERGRQVVALHQDYHARLAAYRAPAPAAE